MLAHALTPALAAAAPGVTSVGDLQAPATAIASGPDGAIWHTSDTKVPRVGRTSLSGSTGEVSLAEKAAPGAIVRGLDGAMWFVDGQGSVVRITSTGAMTTVVEVPGTPRSLAFDASGNLWVTVTDLNDDGGSRSAIGRLRPGGDLTLFESGLSSAPHDIAAGPDGALWFTEPEGDRVGRITTTGAITEFPVPGGPSAIAAGVDGALWFTLPDANAIGRVDFFGTVSTFSAGLPANSQLRDITLGADGAQWFAHRNGVGRIASTGDIALIPTPGLRPGAIALGGDSAIWVTDLRRAVLGRVAGPEALVPVAVPVLGKTIVAGTTRGTARVKVPGGRGFLPLDARASLPVGSVIDATNGRVRLRSALVGDGGKTQTGVFYDGRFEVRQPRGERGLIKIALRGRLECGAQRAVATTSRRRKRRRRVWGSDGGGLFQTLGLDSITTVRGTRWLTEDRCSGTFTRVAEGSVVVRVRKTGRRIVLKAGDSYLARRRP